MRIPLLTFLFTTAAMLSGCSDGSSSGDGSGRDLDLNTTSNNTTLEPLHWEADVLAGADPFNFAPDPANPTGGNLPPCSQSVSACDKYDFTVEGNQTVSLVATLDWGSGANDLDLYLYQGNTQLSSDGINSLPDPMLSTQVLAHGGLTAGTYTFWVVAWNAVNEHYTLDVEFE